MTRRVTAGRRLRARLDADLAEASRQLPDGQALQWDSREVAAIDAAVAAADRREQLARRYDARLAEGADAADAGLVRLSAELRLLERAVVDLLSKVHAGPGAAKSERHQAPANARWAREASWRYPNRRAGV